MWRTGVLLFLNFSAALCAIQAEPVPAVDLAAEGSHEKWIDEVTHSHEEQFRRGVAAYDAHLSVHPEDSVAATEKCLFISYFLYSDEVYIESAEDDFESAEAYLDRFENDPGVELYRIEQLYGEDLVEYGESLLEEDSIAWSPSQVARLHFALSENYRYLDNMPEAGAHAQESMKANPTAAAQLELATWQQFAGYDEQAIETLDRTYPDETPFEKQRRMSILSELGAAEKALVLLRELHREEPSQLDQLSAAQILAEGGELEEAREAFDRAIEEEWRMVEVSRERFEFELKHGSAEAALEAYNRWRDEGFFNDPLLYHRLRLFVLNPELAWKVRDTLGIFGIAGVILVSCLVPLIFLIPVHYWGLIREKAGKSGIELSPSWNLRRAWLVSAFYLLLTAATAYVFIYDAFYEPIFDEYAEEEPDIPDLPLARLIWVTNLAAIAGVFLLGGLARVGKSMAPGAWSVGKCIGLAFLWWLPLKFVGGLLTLLSKDSTDMAGSLTTQSLLAVLEVYGPAALVVSVAVLTPVIEEVIFRGVLLTAFAKYIPFIWANIIQAILFVVMHEELLFYPFLFAFGLVTGLLRKQSQSLLPCIVLHAINNGIVALAMILDR